jgi:hypothetical protein
MRRRFGRARRVGFALVIGSLLASTGASRADDDPQPVASITKDLVADGGVAFLWADPVTAPVAVAYRASDLVADVGAGSLVRQDEFQKTQFLIARGDLGVLKGLKASGADLNTDPRAQDAKASLEQTIANLQMNEGDGGPGGDLWAAMLKFGGEATVEVGFKQAWSWALGHVMESKAVGRFLRKWFPVGDEVKDMIGNRSAFAPELRRMGWRKLGTRAAEAKKAADELTEKLLEKAGEAGAEKALGDLSHDFIGSGYSTILANNPPAPVLRLRIARTPVRTMSDPVTQTIRNDNQYVVHRSNSSWSSGGSSYSGFHSEAYGQLRSISSSGSW